MVSKRTLDRSVDIDYYTAEQLGPSRYRTPEGFLVCECVPVARTGEMAYGPGEVPEELGIGRDGKIIIHRSPNEVFDPKSMASLNGKPVTDEHPPVDVDPHNWRFYTRGVVVSPRRGEGDLRDCLVADMIIFDADTIRDIEMGKREVSCGYNPTYAQLIGADDKPMLGVGEQLNILYNHLALVSRGRCGAKCSIQDHKTVDAAVDVVDQVGVTRSEDFWSERRIRRLSKISKLLR